MMAQELPAWNADVVSLDLTRVHALNSSPLLPRRHDTCGGLDSPDAGINPVLWETSSSSVPSIIQKICCGGTLVRPTSSKSSCPSCGKAFWTGSPTTSVRSATRNTLQKTWPLTYPATRSRPARAKQMSTWLFAMPLATFPADEIVIAVRPTDQEGRKLQSAATANAPTGNLHGIPVRYVVIRE